jgi:DNA (cytosine-5)-methyltransferase 1
VTSRLPGASAVDAPTPDRRPLVRVGRGSHLRPEPRAVLPDLEDIRAVRQWTAAAAAPTAVDIFCGAGGLSLGLHEAGFRVLVGADVDPASVETHSANLGSLGYAGDLSDSRRFLGQLRAWGIRRVDVVAGGVPCQPFSRAGRSKIRSLVEMGRRPAADPRAGLWKSFVEIVSGLGPRAVLLENVPDLTVWNDGAILAGICESLDRLGYRTDARLLDAFDYGVPQHRARLVLVATRPGLDFSWPAPTSRNTVRDAIGDLPPIPPGQRQERLAYSGPQTRLQTRLRDGVAVADRTAVHDHVSRQVRPDDAEAFALLLEGQTYADLPARLQRYRADIFKDKYKRLTWDGLSRSITAHIAKDGYWYIHPDQDRTLSIREAARIQTFPDWFRFAGRPSIQYRQIGNAVPPLLAEALGRALLPGLSKPPRRGRPRGPSVGFRAALATWHLSQRRDLPWRESGDPWLVVLGERILKRRRPDQARALYLALAAMAPTPRDLLAGRGAIQAELRSRGVRGGFDELVEIAAVLEDEHGGTVPRDEQALRLIPHVGESLASAVLTYGHGRPVVILNTDTTRVSKRVRGGALRGRWQARLDLQRLAGRRGPDAEFNSAVSDLAATVCKPAAPQCSDCPVRRHCESADIAGRPALRTKDDWPAFDPAHVDVA